MQEYKEKLKALKKSLKLFEIDSQRASRIVEDICSLVLEENGFSNDTISINYYKKISDTKDNIDEKALNDSVTVLAIIRRIFGFIDEGVSSNIKIKKYDDTSFSIKTDYNESYSFKIVQPTKGHYNGKNDENKKMGILLTALGQNIFWPIERKESVKKEKIPFSYKLLKRFYT